MLNDYYLKSAFAVFNYYFFSGSCLSRSINFERSEISILESSGIVSVAIRNKGPLTGFVSKYIHDFVDCGTFWEDNHSLGGT